MDTNTHKPYSLAQLSATKNTFEFEESSADNLFQHIKREPKHGPRVVAFDLDRLFINNMMNIETSELIKKLQADRCLVIGLTKQTKQSFETMMNKLLEWGVNLNQGFFKDVQKKYRSDSIVHLFEDGFFFVNGESANKKKTLKNTLIKNFQLNPDDVYFVDRRCSHKKATMTFVYEQKKLNAKESSKIKPSHDLSAPPISNTKLFLS